MPAVKIDKFQAHWNLGTDQGRIHVVLVNKAQHQMAFAGPTEFAAVLSMLNSSHGAWLDATQGVVSTGVEPVNEF